MYGSMHAAAVTIRGYHDDAIEAYVALPIGRASCPGVVVLHHGAGWDEWSLEVTRRFAHHGYSAISPHLYSRWGPGDPEDVAARARADGGPSDEQVLGDIEASVKFLRAQSSTNGKVGVIGFCSGGGQTYLALCRLSGIDAGVDCWGGQVVIDPAKLSQKHPIAPVDLTQYMSAPLLGIFGDEDESATPEKADRTEAALQRFGKRYEFHRYQGAGHSFGSWDRVAYRPEQALDAWQRIFAFFGQHLAAAGSG